MISFVVDNGPSEAPSNLLVKLLLVRLRKILNIDKITQISFAEYLSKRNYVERVHAVENNLLSAHGLLIRNKFMLYVKLVVKSTKGIWRKWQKT